MPARSTILQIAQHAEDLDRAVAFYRDVLHLPFVAQFDPPGLAFFDLGGARLLLEHGAPSALLYFEVADIHGAMHELEASGGDVVDHPHLVHRDDAGQFGTAGTEEWMAFFRDSEGNLSAFIERRPPE